MTTYRYLFLLSTEQTYKILRRSSVEIESLKNNRAGCYMEAE